MTDDIQPQKAPKKKPDKDIEALNAAKAEAIKLAEAEGVEVDAGWSMDRIESATLKAMQAKEDAAKQAAIEAAKPPVAPAKPGPAEDPETRAQVMQEAHAAGMDLEDLRGRPLDVVLSMIGKHMTEQAVKRTAEARPDPGRVSVRVLKAGDNKISKGIHLPGVGDLRSKHNDTISMPRDSAEQLEKMGRVEILP